METGKTNSTKNDITDKPQFGGILRNDYKKIAESFNVQFTSIAETIAAKNNPNNRSINNRYLPIKTVHHAYTIMQLSCRKCVIQHAFVYIGGNAFILQRYFHEGLRGQDSPCHHSIVHPTAADGGQSAHMEGSCKYTAQIVTKSLQGVVL